MTDGQLYFSFPKKQNRICQKLVFFHSKYYGALISYRIINNHPPTHAFNCVCIAEAIVSIGSPSLDGGCR